MMLNKIFKEHKEYITSLAALIGMISALLYVAGFFAERVHWNFLGHVDVPEDHMEFLYRGGVIVINSLSVFLLYLISAFKSFDTRSFLIMASIITMLSAKYFIKIPVSIRRVIRLKHPHIFLWLGFSLLLLLIIFDMRPQSWPDLEKDLLFQKNPSVNTSSLKHFFTSYIGITGLWFTFFLLCHRVSGANTRNIDSEATTKPNNLFHDRSWFVKFFPIVKQTSFILMLAFLIYLPAVYGSYYYPRIHPIVQVLLTRDAPEELRLRIKENNAMALLYETMEDYVLYTRQPDPYIIKAKKSAVSALIVHKTADITDTCSFKFKLE